MDSDDGNTFQNEEYGEEEESEEMMAIRSITEEGFSASKAEEFHRKRNQHRGAARDHRTTTIPDSSYSSANQQHQNNKMSEEMLAIQSIMGDGFDSEYAEQYIQEETVIEQEIVESEQILEDINSEDDLEETIIAAATKASKTNERLSNETHDKSSKEEIFPERLPNETSIREKQPKKKLPKEKISKERQPKEKCSKARKLKETESNDRASHDRDRIDRDRPSESDRLSPSEPDDESECIPEEGGLGQTVAEHYNMKKNVGTELRKNSRIVYMRNFNNWTKSMLIDEFLSRLKATHPLGSPIRVLDMGSGKGGDMLKWKNGGVKHVVFADIAAQSIEDCKTRYEELKTKEEAKAYSRNVFSAEFIAVDCSKKRLRSHYEDKALELDLVSCQFCIHYSFESVQQARTMLKNAAECLKPGGYFVGTVPDSNQIIARQRKHPNVSFGSDVYRIECLFDVFGPIPLFGAKYDFNLEGVVNCPEFLVHFGLFERIAGEFGLKLVLKENFKLFYERKSKDHSARQLLRRMNAMETYPPNEGVDTVGQDADYCHAEAYLSEHQNNEKLGTLSKAEWEAITLYQVFAFEKVKGKITPADSSDNNSTNLMSCFSTNKRSAEDSLDTSTNKRLAEDSLDTSTNKRLAEDSLDNSTNKRSAEDSLDTSTNKRLAEDSLDSVSSDSSDSKIARTSPDNT